MYNGIFFLSPVILFISAPEPNAIQKELLYKAFEGVFGQFLTRFEIVIEPIVHWPVGWLALRDLTMATVCLCKFTM